MQYLKIVKHIIPIINGSSGRLIPNPNPTSSILIDNGTKNTKSRSMVSSLKISTKNRIRINGNNPNHGKSNMIAIELIKTKAIEIK
jgi:hypothetical protein